MGGATTLVRFNEIFQEYLFLQPGIDRSNISLRFFDGKSSAKQLVSFDFHNREPTARNVKKTRWNHLGEKSSFNDSSSFFLQSKDIASVGLMRLFAAQSFCKAHADLVMEFAIINHLPSTLTRMVFTFSDKSEAVSSDSSVKEITGKQLCGGGVEKKS